MRFNGAHIAALRQQFAGDQKLLMSLDSIFGENMNNDFGMIGEKYALTDHKPDKVFSTLPTILAMVGDCTGKTVLDLGCGGTGFFTLEFAWRGAQMVYGFDNSWDQIHKARSMVVPENVSFVCGDIFAGHHLLPGDIIVAPYVINYAKDVQALKDLFRQLYDLLPNDEGKLVMVVDLPTGADLKRFGAVKTLLGPPVDGTKIQIDLYNSDKHICTLNSTYFTPFTLEESLIEVGFSKIRWFPATVSIEGVRRFGEEFWKGYCTNPELGYLLAET